MVEKVEGLFGCYLHLSLQYGTLFITFFLPHPREYRYYDYSVLGNTIDRLLVCV